MKTKRILVDMDHVMVNITSQYIKWYKEATGTEVAKNVLLGKPEDLAFPQPQLIRDFLRTPGFFRTAEAMPGSKEVVAELNELFELVIVSSAMEFPQALKEKYDWLAEHFPFISWKQIVFCGSKNSITGDIMIDDHFKNLGPFTGQKLLFTATHNIYTDIEGYTRVNDWEEVRDKLIGCS